MTSDEMKQLEDLREKLTISEGLRRTTYEEYRYWEAQSGRDSRTIQDLHERIEKLERMRGAARNELQDDEKA